MIIQHYNIIDLLEGMGMEYLKDDVIKFYNNSKYCNIFYIKEDRHDRKPKKCRIESKNVKNVKNL